MKKLFFLFLILLVLLLALRFWPDKEMVLEDLTVYDFSASEITQIEISNPTETPFKLLKKDEKWYFKAGTNSCLADQKSVTGILTAIGDLKLKKVLSKTKIAEDSSPIQLTFQTETGKETINLFPVIERQDSVFGYLQFENNPEFFEIEPHLYWSLNLPINHFKDRLVLSLDKDILQNIYLELPVDTIILTKRREYWYRNKNLLDTVDIAQWLEKLNPVYGKTFSTEAPPEHMALIRFSNNKNLDFELYFYKALDSSKVLVKNNYNPAARFSVDTIFYNQIVKKLWQTVSSNSLEKQHD